MGLKKRRERRERRLQQRSEKEELDVESRAHAKLVETAEGTFPSDPVFFVFKKNHASEQCERVENEVRCTRARVIVLTRALSSSARTTFRSRTILAIPTSVVQ